MRWLSIQKEALFELGRPTHQAFWYTQASNTASVGRTRASNTTEALVALKQPTAGVGRTQAPNRRRWSHSRIQEPPLIDTQASNNHSVGRTQASTGADFANIQQHRRWSRPGVRQRAVGVAPFSSIQQRSLFMRPALKRLTASVVRICKYL